MDYSLAAVEALLANIDLIPGISYVGSREDVLVVALIAVVVGFLGLVVLWQSAQSAKWPKVPGVVTTSEIIDHGRTCSLEIIYTFFVDGEKFTGRVKHYTGGMSRPNPYRKEFEKVTAKYPVGLELNVSYNPRWPGYHYIYYTPIWIVAMFPLGVFVMVGGLFWVYQFGF